MRRLAVAVGTIAVMVFSLTALGLVPAQAALIAVTPAVYVNTDGTNVTISGSLTVTSTGQPVPGSTLTLSLANAQGQNIPVGQTSTKADGSYSYSFPQPAAGTYVVTVKWSGDMQYAPSSGTNTLIVTAAPPAPPATSKITLSLDPTETTPGSVVTVSGTLTYGNSPIGTAGVMLSSTYGSIDSMVATDAQGNFTDSVAIPEDAGFPSSYTVTATFAADGSYTQATATATGNIVAAPTTDQPTPSDTASPTESDLPAPEASTEAPAPSAQPSSAASGLTGVAGPAAEIVIVVFFAVALLAAAVLIILGIISHNRKKLATDERRGFGTDFGKEH